MLLRRAGILNTIGGAYCIKAKSAIAAMQANGPPVAAAVMAVPVPAQAVLAQAVPAQAVPAQAEPAQAAPTKI